VVPEDLCLPNKCKELQRADYDQSSSEPSRPTCVVSELAGKRRKLAVYLQLLTGIGVGLFLFIKVADLVLARRMVLFGRGLMTVGVLVLLSGLGAVFFGNWLAVWRQLGL